MAREGDLDIFSRCQQDLASGDLKTCHLGQSKNPKRTVALLGDSHAGAMAPLMDRLGKRLGWDVIASTKSSCPATSARRVLNSETNDQRQLACESFNAEVDRQILDDPAISDVFVTSFTSAYDWDNIPGSALANPGPDGFQMTWKRWTDAGKRVHVLRDVPITGDRAIPNCVELAGSHPETCARARSAALPDDLAATAARAMGNPNVSVLDLTPQFCDATTCFGQIGNVIVYRDTSHISVEYAELLTPFVATQLAGLP
ncbi:SGNH hydrolase domain-containing protein [Pedococcus sp. KACC 23699]|uniref:SGNH hydrolase domain-containing protein n=1 Tax=Pedococcus sp. KACC 23699 TaxID=3149228 RepID=A0AAU7JRB9_9MICO